MKSIQLQILLLLLFFFTASITQAQKWVGASGTSKVEVIDFHSTHRCMTCLAIEKSARSVVETSFANELKSGKIVFRTVDVDDAKNAAIAEKFEAAGTALFVYNGKTGQAVDLTEKAFMYAVNKEEKFKEELRNAIRKALLTL
jgi:thiol-disulfide isomerase/thioredoxin